ncbi:hypothetical protein [Zooshikella sp. RANM57]|uniref:hypothetical protein n=1 Tax=Zooshikella sp. RANM57 TaxID=3425863 RepID=UPI003D6FF812
MKKLSFIISAVAGGALIAGGYFFLTSPDTEKNSPKLPTSNITSHPDKTQKTSTAVTKSAQSLMVKDEHKQDQHSSNREQEILDEAPIQTSPYDLASATVDNLRLLLAEAEGPEKQGKIQSILQSLLENAEKDSSALSSIIDNYKLEPNSEMGSLLQTVLAEIKDPQVETAAFDLAKSGQVEEQLAGLDLLARLDIPSKKTYKLTTGILSSNDNPDILMAALNAMPVITLPEHESQQTIQQLTSLATANTDSGVRSASIFKVGQWAKDENDLSPIVGILNKSKNPDDRISAMMAIQESRIVSNQLRETLTQLIVNDQELWEIRRMAAESLNRYKLSPKEYAAYQAFLKEQGDVAAGN